MALGEENFKERMHRVSQQEQQYGANKRREAHEANLMKSSSGTISESAQARIAEGRPSKGSVDKDKYAASKDYEAYPSNNLKDVM